MVEIIKLTKGNEGYAIDRILKAIKEGKIVIYPTDTVYGLGGDATNEDAIKRIYEIKKRSESKALSVIMADFAMVSDYCELNEPQEMILKKCLPGPYTFILKVKKKMNVTANDKLAIRIPDNDFIREVSIRFGKPIISTSANISGGKDVITFDNIHPEILSACDLAIDAGQTKYRNSSTIVDLIQNRLLREGAGIW